MINRNMKSYNYFALGAENDYGQPQLSEEPVGAIKMAIETSSQSVQDNILYTGATYIGFTHALVDDSFVVSYGDKLLKVLYVNPKGRFKQVFMADYVN
jgi:hypothetical protein